MFIEFSGAHEDIQHFMSRTVALKLIHIYVFHPALFELSLEELIPCKNNTGGNFTEFHTFY